MNHRICQRKGFEAQDGICFHWHTTLNYKNEPKPCLDGYLFHWYEWATACWPFGRETEPCHMGALPRALKSIKARLASVSFSPNPPPRPLPYTFTV